MDPTQAPATPGQPPAPAAPPAPAGPPPITITPQTIQAVATGLAQLVYGFMAANQQSAPAAPPPPPAEPELEPEPEMPIDDGGDEFDDDLDGTPDDLDMDADGDGAPGDLPDDLTDDDDSDPETNCMATTGAHARAGGNPREHNAMSAPSGTNTAVPQGARRPRRNQATYARNGQPDRYAKLEAENTQLKGTVETLTSRVNELEAVGTYTDRYARLQRLAGEGYALDPAEELEATQDFDDDAFAAHEQRIKDRYQRVEPAADEFIQVDRNARAGAPERRDDGLTPAQGREVARYCMDHGVNHDDGLAACREKKIGAFAG